MKAMKMKLFAAAVVSGAALLAMPGMASAEQTSVTGAGALSTNARQDFTVIIPRFLQFRVGAAAGAISIVTCDMTAFSAVLGNSVAQACTDGNLGGGQSTVSVRSNGGPVGITVSTLGTLLSGANTMPYSEIITTSSDPANLPAPILPSGGTSGSVAVAATAGPVTDRSAIYTYTYANTAFYAAGTYGGVNVQNGRATYTASMP